MRDHLQLLAALALMAFPLSAQGQHGEPPTVEEILSVSDRVVSAQVVDIQARWQGQVILSRVTLRVDECLDAHGCDELMHYEVLGGRLEGVAQVVEGMIVPTRGETVVVMTAEEGDGQRGGTWLYFPRGDSDADSDAKNVVLMRVSSSEALQRFVDAVNR